MQLALNLNLTGAISHYRALLEEVPEENLLGGLGALRVTKTPRRTSRSALFTSRFAPSYIVRHKNDVCKAKYEIKVVL